MKRPLTVATAGIEVLVYSTGTVWAQSCSSFQNYAQTVGSYKECNTVLDRDKDEIPCEGLYSSMPNRYQSLT